jgi:putative restriction endonuclease
MITFVKAYVGVTDGDWYRFLAARPQLSEVNFWRPSGGREFRALAIGEPFFFKTHKPHDRVVGGGFFSGFAPLRISEAWTLYDEANGAPSLDDMRARVGRYRRTPIASGEDPMIGCVFVRDVVFFPTDGLAEPPPDFATNIVQGKSYELGDQPARDYFAELLSRLLGGLFNADSGGTWQRPGPSMGTLDSWRNGSASGRSRRWCLGPTHASARSRATRSCQSSRRRTSDRFQRVGNTVSTTGCC